MKALKIENRKVTLIGIDSTSAETELKAMQKAVGGYIEPVRLSENAVMLVDEEGMLKELPQNALASLIAQQMIVGTVLIVGTETDADGETVFTNCPERFVKALM